MSGGSTEQDQVVLDMRLAALLVRRSAARFELGEGDPYDVLAAVRELRAAMDRFRQAAAWRGDLEEKL